MKRLEIGLGEMSEAQMRYRWLKYLSEKEFEEVLMIAMSDTPDELDEYVPVSHR